MCHVGNIAHLAYIMHSQDVGPGLYRQSDGGCRAKDSLSSLPVQLRTDE
jgi:hypothetical protein